MHDTGKFHFHWNCRRYHNMMPMCSTLSSTDGSHMPVLTHLTLHYSHIPWHRYHPHWQTPSYAVRRYHCHMPVWYRQVFPAATDFLHCLLSHCFPKSVPPDLHFLHSGIYTLRFHNNGLAYCSRTTDKIPFLQIQNTGLLHPSRRSRSDLHSVCTGSEWLQILLWYWLYCHNFRQWHFHYYPWSLQNRLWSSMCHPALPLWHWKDSY